MRIFHIRKLQSLMSAVLVLSLVLGSVPSVILAADQDVFVSEETVVAEEQTATEEPVLPVDNAVATTETPILEVDPTTEESETGNVVVVVNQNETESENVNTPDAGNEGSNGNTEENKENFVVGTGEVVAEPIASIEETVTHAPRRPLPAELQALKEKQKKEVKPFVSGEILVRFKEKMIDLTTEEGGGAAVAFVAANGLTITSTIAASNIAVVAVPAGEETETIAKLKYQPEVLHAQVNVRYHSTTNDVLFSSLWALENTGQVLNGVTGTADKDVDAPEAWGKNEGNGVIVAVIDSGVAFNHPDLLANMWNGANCVDENGASLGGCQHGYDFEDEDKNPLPTIDSHGTYVAGTIAAVGNNTVGIVGVSPRAQIMALKVEYTAEQIVRAIDFAERNGAHIINTSFGGPTSGVSVDDLLVKEAMGLFGGMIVASAGNDATDHGITPSYPCAFDLPNIICVAATDQNDALASFSDYGATSVDVGAPGTNIVSTVANTTVMAENFNAVTAPNLPNGWTKTGDWGTFDFSGDKVLYGDYNHIPYLNNANGSVTSPTFNLGGNTNGAGISFGTLCDTEYDTTTAFLDYMALEVSGDGANYTEILKWNESYLDFLNNEFGSSGSAGRSFDNLSVPSQFLSTNFTFRFRWVTNASNVPVQDYDGCFVDDISITKFSDGSDELYEFLSGTSIAAPHVAGLTALLKSYNPNLTDAQAKQIVLNSGDALSSLAGKTVSGKRINANNALNTFAPRVGMTTEDEVTASAQSTSGEPFTVSFAVKDGIDGLPFTMRQFEYSTDGGVTWRAPENGDGSAAIGNFATLSGTTGTEFPTLFIQQLGVIEPAVRFNVAHADLSGLTGVDQNDVRVRFKAHDGAIASPFAMSAAFQVDLLAPTATLTGTPAALTNAQDIAITVGGTDAVAYRFALDNLPFTAAQPIANPIARFALIDGTHTLRVIAIDDVGNAQATADATTITWTIDTTAGTASLISKPDVRTNQTAATFVIGGDSVVTYTYMFDGGAAQGPFAVSAPIALIGLVEGAHTMVVTGIDALGNTQQPPTTYTWVIDTSPSAPTLSGVPTSPTKLTTATVTVGGTDVVAYRFALNGGAFGAETPVATPITLTNLTDSTQTLAVIGRDDVGNWQAETSATTVSWIVDTLAPPLASAAIATPTNDTTPTVSIIVGVGATWQILRGETVLASGIGTGTAQSAPLATLTDGIYTLTMTATDAAGNSASITFDSFVVDTTSPSGLSLEGVPDSPTNAPTATIRIVAGNDFVAYRFSHNGGAFGSEAPVATPITLTNLTDGTQTVSVIARDAAGNFMAESGAVTATWMVDTIAPAVVLSTTPKNPTPSSRARITVAGTDVVAYRVAVGSVLGSTASGGSVASLASVGGSVVAIGVSAFGSETPVATPITLTDLADGEHTVMVIGRDRAGNYQDTATATTFTWTVDSSIAVPPIATPTRQNFVGSLDVTFLATDADLIRYTLDDSPGLRPSCDASSPVGSSFSSGMTLSFTRTTTIFAVACYGDTTSPVATFTYTKDSIAGGRPSGGGSERAATSVASPSPIVPNAAPVIPIVIAPTVQVLGTRVFANDALLRTDDRSIYLVRGRTLHRIPDLDTLRRFAHRTRIDVVAADIDAYTIGTPVAIFVPSSPARALLRVDARDIYVVNGTTLHRIPDIRTLWPYRGYTRTEVSADAITAFAIGDPVQLP